MNPRKTLRRGMIALVVAAGLAVGGCGFDPAEVPVPGSAVSGPTYRVQIEFSSALNLPAKSKVIANGAEIGTVDTVRVIQPADAPAGRGGYVVVEADIQDSVQLPTTTIAELRQDTILGDIHVALTTPKDGFGALLRDGGTIPIERTKPPVQLEDTMATMALFVQGGAIGQLQEMIGRVNSVMPADPKETARISAVMGADAADLAAHLDQVDLLVNGLAANAEIMVGIEAELTHILTPEAVRALSGTQDSIAKTMAVFLALGPVGSSLTWLAPIANAGDAAATAFLPLATGGSADLRSSTNMALLTALLRDKVIPFAERGPKVNVTGVRVSEQEQVDQIVTALRMIGMVR
ncbi:mammalian cell entry protein [Nocardia sp. MH4]|uniref:MlaD family protein n=1 Tax=unclassified Nocardia TaxID=2637762 RepID=UPI001C4F7137|nr:MlaD family protein [Nocardia sp. MH4]MBW0270004.1 mammalian cell entry protein [Nocardia sp. MH4]